MIDDFINRDEILEDPPVRNRYIQYFAEVGQYFFS